MSLTSVLSSAEFMALFLLLALAFDMGIKYRVQLMYSATHESATRRPSYRIRFAGRHACLAIVVCWAAYLYQLRPITEITMGIVVLTVLSAVYCGLIVLDAIREMKSSSIG